MYKTAGVVVLYNPEMNVIDNVNTYINQVEKLYVIDNSDNINNFFLEKIRSLNKAEYICNNGNIGIAAALNKGAKRAIEEGFEYLLTMDQDSQAPSYLVSKLFECFSEDSKIALVSPIHHSPKGRDINKSAKTCVQVFTAWTSGNLLNLNIFKITEGFKEDFFIDYVDHEFCLRLNEMGFKIYVCNDAILKHNLGNIEEKNLIFRKIYTTNHSALRLYYRTRNRFYVRKIYKNIFPDFIKQENQEFWKTFVKVILFEKNRLKKIKSFIIGYIDYKKNKFGKFDRKV